MAIRGIPVLLPVICLIVISVCSNLFVSSNPVETDDQPAFQSARPTTSTAPSATNNNYNPFSRISNYFNQWRDTRARFQQEQRLTSFFRVCVEGSIDKIDRLISPSRRHAPIDINMVDDSTGNQFTCLIKAALNHEHEMVEYLLSRGASLTHLDIKGRNVLQLVIGLHGSSVIVSSLLKHAHKSLTPNELSSFVNNQCTNPNLSCPSALRIAIFKNREHLVKLLLSDNTPIDLDLVSNHLSKQNAVMLAIKYGNLNILQLVLRFGNSNLNHMDERQNTPLTLACFHYDDFDSKLQHLLLYEGGRINPNTVNIDGVSPLFACARRSVQRTQLLGAHFKNRLNYEMLDQEGKSVLFKFVEMNSYSSVRVTLEIAKKESNQLSQVLEQRINGTTCLHLACYKTGNSYISYKRVIELLVDEGSNVDAVNNMGETPLMLALNAQQIRYNDAVIDILVNKAGANLTMRNRVGKTAADIAYGKGRDNIGRYLSCRMSIIKPLDHEETECCVCFKEFNSENPRLKPYHCDHSVDHVCFQKMETAAAVTSGPDHPLQSSSVCPLCRAVKALPKLQIE